MTIMSHISSIFNIYVYLYCMIATMKKIILPYRVVSHIGKWPTVAIRSHRNRFEDYICDPLINTFHLLCNIYAYWSRFGEIIFSPYGVVGHIGKWPIVTTSDTSSQKLILLLFYTNRQYFMNQNALTPNNN